MSSIINSIFTPAIASLYPLILSKKDMKIGKSYRTMLSKLQLILGVGLSGILFNVMSIELIMLINGVSFIISSLFERQIKESYIIQNTKEKFLSLLKNGLNYVIKTPLLFHYNVLSTLLNLYFVGYLAIFVRYIFLEYYNLNEIYYSNTVIAYSIIIILTTYIINKIDLNEYYAILIGLFTQLFAIVMSLMFIDHLYLFIISILLSNVGLIFYNIPMVSKIMCEIDKEFMSRAIGTMSFISSVTMPLSNYIYGLLLEKYNVEFAIIFTLFVLIVSVIYVLLRKEFRFDDEGKQMIKS
ncbi:MFS transporter [Haloplasma contractile]|uniref:Major facilitator superfamily MFS 1 protein n=1 Tax=Haloplasma contractile SSD-17B TaxID=1033810 RepID=U2E821_9MOLU|nr:MFS transporter [Haloplasma contractile]ERJ11016.1 Major facilitator superfamily MFS 1 protein [Haloplasma contractile SSD-17B]